MMKCRSHIEKTYLTDTPLGNSQADTNMAKKSAPTRAPKVIPHKDHYARISFLYQASNKFCLQPKYQILSRGYGRNLDLVAKKTVLKLSPALKRTLCKKCDMLLIPGLTMTMKIENESKAESHHNDVLVHTCIKCGEKRRFPVGKNRHYDLFSEREGVELPAE